MLEREVDLSVANEVARISWKDKLTYKSKVSLLKTAIICLCIVLCVCVYFACDAAKYAVDRNYDYLQSLVIETETIETVTERYDAVSESGDGGTANAVAGTNNRLESGDE